jgi:endonuclease YncB( thermonuclease family)
VYDGDTLTLGDQRRVRFLGIDAPELKEKQPFAEEAKQFVQNLCRKGQDIWLSFEGDRQDHYGRLLAFLWVPQGKGWVCVNEAIVAAGLATVYVPNASSKLFNKDKLIALQREARLHKRGMWSKFQDTLVVKTSNGAAYHIRSCSYLESTHHLTEMRSSQAADLGLHPCRKCLA